MRQHQNLVLLAVVQALACSGPSDEVSDFDDYSYPQGGSENAPERDPCEPEGFTRLSDPFAVIPEEVGSSKTNLFPIGDNIYFDAGLGIYKVPKTGGAPSLIYVRRFASEQFWAHEGNVMVLAGESLVSLDADTGAELKRIELNQKTENFIDVLSESLGNLFEADQKYVQLSPDGRALFGLVRDTSSTLGSRGLELQEWVGIFRVDTATGEISWPVLRGEDEWVPISFTVASSTEAYALFGAETYSSENLALYRIDVQGEQLDQVPLEQDPEKPIFDIIGTFDGELYLMGGPGSFSAVTFYSVPMAGGVPTALPSGFNFRSYLNSSPSGVSRQEGRTLLWYPGEELMIDGKKVLPWGGCGFSFATEDGVYSRYGDHHSGLGFRAWSDILAADEL